MSELQNINPSVTAELLNGPFYNLNDESLLV